MSSSDDESDDGKPPAKRLKEDTDSQSADSGGSSFEDPSREDPSAESESSVPHAKDPKIWGNIETMVEIVKSPYEPPNASAEVGEPAFDELKKLLVSPDNKGTAHPQAARLLGSKLAENVITAFEAIGKSGMLWSPQWVDGKIRGVDIGWIPKPVLLLCLHEQRFVRAQDATLSSLIKDLEVDNIIGDAISEYKLDREFINLSSNTSYTFTRNKAVCYKCEIFAARAFRSVKALKWKRIDPSLWKKIKHCLTIMNEHVRVSKNGVAKRISELDEDEGVGEKKAPKKAVAKKQKETETDEEPETILRRRDQNLEAIDMLIGLYGEHADRMGQIVGHLKRKLQQEMEDRESWMAQMREQIRREVLQEQNGSRS